MIRQYLANVRVDGHYSYEDPKCPSEWLGSGCYDIDVETWCEPTVEVWANSFAEAEKLVEEYDYAFYHCVSIDNVQILSIKMIKIMPDRGDDEVGVIEPVNIEWIENERETREERFLKDTSKSKLYEWL